MIEVKYSYAKRILDCMETLLFLSDPLIYWIAEIEESYCNKIPFLCKIVLFPYSIRIKETFVCKIHFVRFLGILGVQNNIAHHPS